LRPGPSGTAGNNKNVFQGQLTSSSAISWTVPIDPPGANGTRVIRIANMRANANRAPGAAGLLLPMDGAALW